MTIHSNKISYNMTKLLIEQIYYPKNKEFGVITFSPLDYRNVKFMYYLNFKLNIKKPRKIIVLSIGTKLIDSDYINFANIHNINPHFKYELNKDVFNISYEENIKIYDDAETKIMSSIDEIINTLKNYAPNSDDLENYIEAINDNDLMKAFFNLYKKTFPIDTTIKLPDSIH